MNISSNSSRKSPFNIKIIAAIAIGVLIVGAGIAYFSTKESADKSQIVAKIDGKAVTLDEANLRLEILQRQGQQAQQSAKKLSFLDLDPEAKKVVIREEAAHRLLVVDARKKNVIKSQDLKKEKETFEENLLQKLLLENIANESIKDDSVIKAAYEKQVDKVRGQQEIRARHILVKTEEDARKVKELLDTKSFKDVAKEMSIDQKTAKDGGDLGVLYTGNILKTFEEVINKLKPGEISDPVKSELGWHIVKLDSKTPAKILAYEQAKPKVAVEVSKEAIRKYVDELLADVKIDIL